MALQNASVHKAFADTQLGYDYGGSIMLAVESDMMAATRLDPPKYDIFLQYPIDKDRNVTQPDASTVDCTMIIEMLEAYDYIVSHQIKYGVVKMHIKVK